MGEPAQKRENPLARIVGSVDDPGQLTNRLTFAAQHFHLVAPQTAVGVIPEGCSVALSAVVIDVAHETYPIPGSSNRGLGKVALDRIAAGAGVSWDPRQSGRLDDGSDPHYCHYRAVGTVREFDGTVRTLVSEKEVDVREGSPQVDAIVERCISKLKRENSRLSDAEAQKRGRQAGENQIREIRLHILGHAETKARLRAIRTLGIRTAYEPAELQKPFVVAKIVWSGRTDDPYLRREFALNQQRAMLGASEALYGGSPQQAANGPATSAPPARPGVSPPPPVGTVDDSWDEESGVVDAAVVDDASPASSPKSSASHSRRSANGHVIPGGKAKGTPLAEAEDRDLTYWHKRIGEELEAGTSKFPERDEDLFEALDDELRRRRGEPEAEPSEAPSNDDSADFRDDEVF